MKVFIAGARSIKSIDSYITGKLDSICDKQFSILVGDCYGVDAMVQSYLAKREYSLVTVYASNGVARYNVGGWHTNNVSAGLRSRGFDFYRQKDIAMARDADLGFMIWDCNSKGTLYNILTLAKQKKTTVVYMPNARKTVVIRSLDDVSKFSCEFSDATMREYEKFSREESNAHDSQLRQMAMF